jgi:hypothetical protein
MQFVSETAWTEEQSVNNVAGIGLQTAKNMV